MIKILFLINHAGKAGTEKYVREMASFAKQQGAEVFFVYNEHGLLADYMQNQQFISFQIKMRHPLDIHAASRLAAICKKHKIDIIHAQYARENYIAILSKLFGSGAAVVYTAHFHIKNNLLWRCTNRIFTRVNHVIIAVCTSIKAMLIENKCPPDKIKIIFNGVAPTLNPRTKPGGIFTFVTMSRLSPEKGLMFLLASVKILSQSGRKFKVLIAGDGEMLSKMENYIAAHNLGGFVDLLGYRSDLLPILRISHVYICPSKTEATSFSVLEAMSQSLPAIVTNIGGLPDIVNEKTNCGLLVEYGDCEAMSRAMERLMGDQKLYDELSQNACVAVNNLFTTERMASETYNIYKELIHDD